MSHTSPHADKPSESSSDRLSPLQRPLRLTAEADAPLPSNRVAREVMRIKSGRMPVSEPDELAQETPVALTFNGISHATMLTSPTDLEDFAVGFALTEGIVANVAEIRDIAISVESRGVVIDVDIAAIAFNRLKTRRRTMAGRTGCGLCGVESLDEVLQDIAPVVAGNSWKPSVLAQGMRAMRESQQLHNTTGATHAAAYIDPDGSLAMTREDVGRHNALDKLLGRLARRGIDVASGAVLVSSRASFEMVQKTASQGGTVLVAASAPTDMAWQVADRCGITLIGFMRGDDFSVYSGPERIEVQGR